jgi:hypothetical protein
VKRSLREILADSHIAAVAIAVLLLWSLNSGFQALRDPVPRAASFSVEAVAIRGIPFGSREMFFSDWIMLIPTFAYLLGAATSLGAAWLVSRWVFGAGPLTSLSKYGPRLARRKHV